MQVVYEDNHIIVVYKESGEIVQGCRAHGKKRNICRNRIVDRARTRRNDGGNYGYRR